jgi:NAD(P)-dependent dehydrogenase (short-subunit alcohol dehydrogenase family)
LHADPKSTLSSTATRPLTLVTGASSGIGLELAKQFAANGFDLILTAHDDLTDAAVAIRPSGVSLDTITIDLADPGGVDELWNHVKGTRRPLAAAALNAGRGEGRGVRERVFQLTATRGLFNWLDASERADPASADDTPPVSDTTGFPDRRPGIRPADPGANAPQRTARNR